MMKQLLSIFLCYSLLGLLVFSSNISAQTYVEVDWQGSNLPDINYKRGISAPGMNGFFDSNSMRGFIDYQSGIGMGIFNGIRNLFKDPETNEFYYENGVYKNRQKLEFATIRKYAKEAGFELISQVGGTPRNSNYEFDITFRKRPDPTFYEPDVDFAPIPAEGTSMSEFQRNFSEWAINADKVVGEDFHSIWIGTQEITHTIGFRDGITNATTKKEAIRRWVDYWKPISDNLRAAGARTGGVQMNSGTGFLYNYAVDYMIEKQLQLDYLTFQFYQWGDTVDLAKAIEAVERYNKVYPDTKLIIDRGAYGKIVPDGVSQASSQGVIYFLTGELGLMNHANQVYAYSLDCGVNTMEKEKTNLTWLTKEWLNKTGKKRCGLSGMPAGVDGFAVRSDKKLSVVMWNRGNNIQNVNLHIDNIPINQDSEISAKYAKGNSFTNANLQWDAESKIIEGISLERFDYILIDFISSIDLSVQNEFENKLKVYPNPAYDNLFVNSDRPIGSLSIYSIDGRLICSNKNQTQISCGDIAPGAYILRVEADRGMVGYKKIIIK